MEDFAIRKLLDIAHKPLRAVIQLDGWAPWPGETVRQVSGGISREFQEGDFPVRCIILPSAKREDVLSLLDEIRDWIVSYPVWPMFNRDRTDIYPDVKLVDPVAALRKASAVVKDLDSEQVCQIKALLKLTSRRSFEGPGEAGKTSPRRSSRTSPGSRCRRPRRG